MIPIRDTEPSFSKPVIVRTIVFVNALAFLYELSLGGQLQYFIGRYGLVPATYFGLTGGGAAPFPQRVIPVFTSMFLHAGWMHIIFNMLFLWIFGDNVEDRLGKVRFVFFYLACGAAGAYLQLYLNARSVVPMVGASGAIAGVMGAYFILFPRARVLALVPIFFFLQVVELPAVVFLGFWFVLQFFSGTATLLSGAASKGGTAWWAHIGGFGAGVVLVKLLSRRTAGPNRRQAGLGGKDYGTSPDEATGGEHREFRERRSSRNVGIPWSRGSDGW